MGAEQAPIFLFQYEFINAHCINIHKVTCDSSTFDERLEDPYAS